MSNMASFFSVKLKMKLVKVCKVKVLILTSIGESWRWQVYHESLHLVLLDDSDIILNEL